MFLPISKVAGLGFRLFGEKKAPKPRARNKVQQPEPQRVELAALERGRKLFDLNAVPAKDVLRNKAQVCPPLSALCEILDNIFDNYKENGPARALEIRFGVERKGESSSLAIVENSGGVKREKLEPLVRLGVPYHGAKGSIGTWGEGLKVAAFSLSPEVEIRTHFPGDSPVSVVFDKDWLRNPEWNVPVYALGPTALPAGSTQFILSKLIRSIDWSEMMRELAVIYGHKILELEEEGGKVVIRFAIDGQTTQLQPKPLASVEALAARMAFPPDFAPRAFNVEFLGEHGPVQGRVVVALTARHSTETSGIYIYGNGRLFARALRTRAVGYNESGNAVLRDHPSCWRIHVFAFLRAEEGADIPWQAPLKDGVSENHPVTTRLRDFIKDVVAPYSRFAKTAKASELVPYTTEWDRMSAEERAKLLFEDDSDAALTRLRSLPADFQKFVPPTSVESLTTGSRDYERTMKRIDDQSRYVRSVIQSRNAAGPLAQEVALRALNPKPFSGNGSRKASTPAKAGVSPAPVPQKTKGMWLEIPVEDLEMLHEVFNTRKDDKAVIAAIEFCLEKIDEPGKSPAKPKRKGR